MSIFYRAGGQLALVTGLALIPTAAATPAAPRGGAHAHPAMTPSGSGQSFQQGNQNRANVGTGQTSAPGHQNKTNTTATHKQQSQQNAAALTQLRAAHALLVHQADHDYQGHRAKAAHQVSAAIHALSGGNNNGAGGGQNQVAGGKNQQAGVNNQQAAAKVGNNQQAGGQAGQGAPKIPQAQSDANLQKAAQMLHTALGQVHSGHQASTHIQTAITEIGTALKVK